MMFFLVLMAFAALVVTAFCAGAETGFLSVQLGHVVHVAREGGVRAKVILSAVTDLGRTTTALLVGSNLASVTYSSCVSALGASFFAGSSVASGSFSIGAAILILFIGEFLPKLLCSARPLRRLLHLAPFWLVFAQMFVPVGSIVQLLIEWMMPRKPEKVRMTPETVLKVLEDRKEGVRLSDFERLLVERLMTLRSRGEFVTPDSLVSALDELR